MTRYRFEASVFFASLIFIVVITGLYFSHWAPGWDPHPLPFWLWAALSGVATVPCLFSLVWLVYTWWVENFVLSP